LDGTGRPAHITSTVVNVPGASYVVTTSSSVYTGRSISVSRSR
jgi:hypothetical protein